MMERDFKVNIAGPEAEETAKELSNFIKKEFGHKPVCIKQETQPQKENVRSFDPMTAVAIAVAIPSAILAAVDLAARLANRLKDRQLVVIFGKYDAEFILEEIESCAGC